MQRTCRRRVTHWGHFSNKLPQCLPRAKVHNTRLPYFSIKTHILDVIHMTNRPPWGVQMFMKAPGLCGQNKYHKNSRSPQLLMAHEFKVTHCSSHYCQERLWNCIISHPVLNSSLLSQSRKNGQCEPYTVEIITKISLKPAFPKKIIFISMLTLHD